jgi:PHD/YefM family antitoxin component YafN of YafNO toxin-antitoxin module
MSRVVTYEELASNLAGIFEQLQETDEPITVVRDGTPTAVISPMRPREGSRYEPKTREEVLELFRQRKISAQRAAELLKMSHGEFTKLASQHGIDTGSCPMESGLLDLLLSKKIP